MMSQARMERLIIGLETDLKDLRADVEWLLDHYPSKPALR